MGDCPCILWTLVLLKVTVCIITLKEGPETSARLKAREILLTAGVALLTAGVALLTAGVALLTPPTAEELVGLHCFKRSVDTRTHDGD